MAPKEITLAEHQRRAAKARHAKLSPDQRSEQGRRVARARWDAMTAEERRAAVSPANAARRKTKRRNKPRKSRKQ